MADGKRVVLCVDDDQDILDGMKLFLEAQGYEPVLATSAEAGLVLYKQQTPDIVFVDLMMEEVDAGTGLAKELRALGNSAPIYMLSSVGNTLSTTANYAELGLSGVLQKPVDFDTLLAILKQKVG